MKYLCTVEKETIKNYDTNNEMYYSAVLNLIQGYKNQDCKLYIGNKHIRILDSNGLEVHTETPPSIKDFKEFCKTKGIGFKKK